MKRAVILIMAFLAIIMGCSNDAVPTDINQILNDSIDAQAILSPFYKVYGFEYQNDVYSNNFYRINKNAVTRPFKSRSAGTISFLFEDDACDGLTKVLIEGEGNATHLGKFELIIMYCTDGVNPIFPILATQTAANGDQLFSYLANVGFDEDLGYYQDYVIYGGSNRFENAFGEIRLYGAPDYENLVFSNYGEGTITY